MTDYIEIKLFASLSEKTPKPSDRYPIDTGITVRELIDQLAVPENEAKLIFINGRKGELTSILKDGDRVGIFPPVGGG